MSSYTESDRNIQTSGCIVQSEEIRVEQNARINVLDTLS